jgi:heat shock protein HslJ
MKRRALISDALVVVLLLGAVHCGPAREEATSDTEVTPSTQAGLEGTSWRLLKFQGGDETTLTPTDDAQYTIAFEPAGRLTARIDCNRGRVAGSRPDRLSSSSVRWRSPARCARPDPSTTT